MTVCVLCYAFEAHVATTSATDWSGPAAYLTTANSYPVPITELKSVPDGSMAVSMPRRALTAQDVCMTATCLCRAIAWVSQTFTSCGSI